MSGYRVPGRGRVDTNQPIRAIFDGKAVPGFAGDTLASALLARGRSLVARSFKYHRPRGILGAGSEEPNALVGVDRGPGRYTPNVRATTIELHEGLVVETQNRWPTLGFDAGAATSLLSGLFPAGFYNKTFMWPRAAWEKLYEPAIRRMAGLGSAPDAIDADRYTATYAHCDVAVIGAGRAGIEAALAAARAGGRVVLMRRAGRTRRQAARAARARGNGSPSACRTHCGGRHLAGAHHRDRPVPRRLRRRGRAVDRSPASAPRGTGPRERLHRIRAGRIVLADGRDRAAAGVRRQRPSGRDAGERGARPTSTATASRSAARWR